MPVENPPHPGDFIQTEIIKPAGLSGHSRSTCLTSFTARAIEFAQC